MAARRAGSDEARQIVQYLCLMFVLLACALMVALILWPKPEHSGQPICGGVALYPLERLAMRGDVGAMAYLGGRLTEEGCNAQAQARGAAYLEQAAAAGHPDAQSVLARSKADGAAVASPCAALLAMMMPGVDDAHQVPGACDRP
ncbi:hypothetical protein [Tateyamaria omphalii]|uniref:Sel1 repeat family protein n=1 Tax=Tateyamaria omphalii TaxID=299262 RepID=A0A1P8N1A0_9RHOB|nr:hypothetical protein [Tateyamaria omphalii]APX14094.1 hypothetical protein BWR18_19720 [Tateyamaria omphalii]